MPIAVLHFVAYRCELSTRGVLIGAHITWAILLLQFTGRSVNRNTTPSNATTKETDRTKRRAIRARIHYQTDKEGSTITEAQQNEVSSVSTPQFGESALCFMFYIITTHFSRIWENACRFLARISEHTFTVVTLPPFHNTKRSKQYQCALLEV